LLIYNLLKRIINVSTEDKFARPFRISRKLRDVTVRHVTMPLLGVSSQWEDQRQVRIAVLIFSLPHINRLWKCWHDCVSFCLGNSVSHGFLWGCLRFIQLSQYQCTNYRLSIERTKPRHRACSVVETAKDNVSFYKISYE